MCDVYWQNRVDLCKHKIQDHSMFLSTSSSFMSTFFPFVAFMKPGVEPFMDMCQACVHETGISCSITGFHFNKLAPNYPSIIVQGLTDGIRLSTRPACHGLSQWGVFSLAKDEISKEEIHYHNSRWISRWSFKAFTCKNLA